MEELAIDQAAKIIDNNFLGVACAYYNAQRAAERAKRLAREAEDRMHQVRRLLMEDATRLGADNSVPGKSVPNMLAAAYRELGLR